MWLKEYVSSLPDFPYVLSQNLNPSIPSSNSFSESSILFLSRKGPRLQSVVLYIKNQCCCCCCRHSILTLYVLACLPSSSFPIKNENKQFLLTSVRHSPHAPPCLGMMDPIFELWQLVPVETIIQCRVVVMGNLLE